MYLDFYVWILILLLVSQWDKNFILLFMETLAVGSSSRGITSDTVLSSANTQYYHRRTVNGFDVILNKYTSNYFGSKLPGFDI